MYLHPDTILALHDARRHRLEAEAARSSLIRAILRRRPPRRHLPVGMFTRRRAFRFPRISIDMPVNGP